MRANTMSGIKRWRSALVALAAGLALVGAGCAKKAAAPGAGGAPSGSSPATSSSGSPGNPYGATGGYGRYGGGSSPTGTVAAGTVQQGAGGALVFSPTTVNVAKGQKLTVVNVGSAVHTFTVSGHGIDLVNNPGQRGEVTINLAPGTYQFICRFHVSFGMKGTLVVTG